MIPLHDDNPTQSTPILTIALITICVLVYFFQAALGPRGGETIIYSLGVIPAVLLDKVELSRDLVLVPAELTIFTSMFLHGGFLHLAGNMLYLWIFGNNIEDALGKVRFLIFYFLCGIVAAFGQIMQDPDSTIPMVGASGAISGVLGAYLLLFPHARVLVLVPMGFFMQMMKIPAGLVLGLWFVLQLVSSALTSSAGGGVAWFAHIGGFIAGMLLILVMKRKNVKLFQPGHGTRRW
ncbi:MAG: rhomboid family intramembrane serine protease [Gammaproteobacteria bacterium RIFCSPLOWO2_12_FULL_52_10]|nr:MAG: rhomboid family intramembrane serine protease [Gammaproteobacteria bacterium RIFCSPLOWO2_12_FULL_52_10]